MPEAVYLLCLLTSTICSVQLLRGWRQRRTTLLLWSGLCFVLLAANNALLFIDLILMPSNDLSLWRGLTQLAGGAVLLYGLIWHVR